MSTSNNAFSNLSDLSSEFERMRSESAQGASRIWPDASNWAPEERDLLESVRALVEDADYRTSVAKSAQEGSATASMQVDLDRNITYLNPATIALVTKNLDVFQAAFPRIDFSNLLGTSIDVFHKNPDYQRQILADPNNLPHTADIEVGDLKFALNISAMRDGNGEHIGANLEWQDVTNLRKQEREAARLKSAIEGSGTASMQVDRDLILTGANPATVKLISENLAAFQAAFPKVDFNNLIGTCIDVFHQNPQMQRTLLSDESNLPHTAEIEVLGLTFALNISAMRDADGNYIGANLEWSNVTERKQTEAQQQLSTKAIEELVEAAQSGNLSARADASMLTGSFRTLVEGVNEMLEAILAPVSEASEVLESVANQDLRARVQGEYVGDHAAIKNNLNRAVENLEKALAQVGEVTSEVSSATDQISQGSQQVADGASTQASSIEEISASLEEMSSMTSQNADNAQQAKALADEAKSAADKGNEQMGRLKEAIDAIKASSDQTAKIVKTIDEISFQTNMLALNAAVEAARAGDAGKGFAVVAEEVRSLAQRSAEAAKTTAELIEGSGKNVDNGVSITGAVQEILDEITSGSTKVTDLITEIAAASKEQAEGISQVNSAVDGMNSVIQDNAANSEQSSAAAVELAGQVTQLMGLVSEFDLTENIKKPPVTTAAPSVRAEAAPVRPAAPKPVAAAAAFPLDDDELADF